MKDTPIDNSTKKKGKKVIKSAKKKASIPSHFQEMKVLRELLDSDFRYDDVNTMFISDWCTISHLEHSGGWGMCPIWSNAFDPYILHKTTHLHNIIAATGIRLYYISGIIRYKNVGDIFIDDIWDHAHHKKENFTESLIYFEKQLFTEAVLDGAL